MVYKGRENLPWHELADRVLGTLFEHLLQTVENNLRELLVLEPDVFLREGCSNGCRLRWRCFNHNYFTCLFKTTILIINKVDELFVKRQKLENGNVTSYLGTDTKLKYVTASWRVVSTVRSQMKEFYIPLLRTALRGKLRRELEEKSADA